jgi:hypothetical protein
MLVFGQLDSAVMVGVSAERVDHLLGDRARWEFPVSLLLGTGLALAGLGALVLVAAHMTEMAQINASMLLMQSCGPLMVGLAALTLTAAIRGRRSQ